jgi:tripeptide aminopeptidase
METTLLKQLYKINSKSCFEDDMQEFIMSYAKQRECVIDMDKRGNILVTYGEADAYPCICAHMDEVHHAILDKEVIEFEDFMFCFSPSKMGVVGCGADDKNGIFIALKALDVLPAVKLLFTVEEEIGAVGAYNVNIKKWLKNVRYVIQCDRRGSDDFITSISGIKLASKEFKKDAGTILKGYGFHESTGMLTDVMALKEGGLNVSCCNLSCGYYAPHSDREVTYLPHLEKTFNAVMEICLTLTKTYQHNYEKPTYKKYSSAAITSANAYGNRNYLNIARSEGGNVPLNPESVICRDCLRLNCDYCAYSVPSHTNYSKDWDNRYYD